MDTFLRYVVQLLTPSKLLAQMSGRDTITKQDVDEVRYSFDLSISKMYKRLICNTFQASVLFIDSKRSACVSAKEQDEKKAREEARAVRTVAKPAAAPPAAANPAADEPME